MLQPHILKLPTPRLLAYYKKHYRHSRNPNSLWTGGSEPAEGFEKEYAEWDAEQAMIKTELNKRENVEK